MAWRIRGGHRGVAPLTVMRLYRRRTGRQTRTEGDLEIDLWYDDTGVLVGLAFETRGSQVTYRLVERQGNVPASSADTVLNMRN